MLKNYFPLVFVLLFLNNIYSQTTAIPDANFEQALIDLGIDSDLTINQSVLTSDISGITSLNVPSLDISDLTGIEDFVSLTLLDCRSNQLTSLDLSQNSVLTFILCDRNQLTSLDVKNGNNSNLFLKAFYNRLKCINVDNVIDAELSSEPFGSWEKDFTTRYSEDCNNTIRIFDDNFEQVLIDKGIDTDGIINQSVSKYDVLGVSTLDVSSKGIRNLIGIEEFKNLTYLNCSDNELTSLNVKNGNNSLITYFNASSNASLQCIAVDSATDANAGVGLYSTWQKDVATTYMDECPKTYVPDDGFETILFAKGYDDIMDDYVLTSNINTLTDLSINEHDYYDWRKFPRLYDMTGIKDFISLEHLSLSESYNIESLDLSNHPSLKSFFFRDSGIGSLDFSNCITLNSISGLWAGVGNTDFSNCIALTTINARSIGLGLNLDLTTCTALTSLTLSGSGLPSLNVKNGNNSILTSFSVTSLPNLTCIDVDNKTDADAGNGSYSTWVKPDTSFYSEDCTSALGVDDEVLAQGISLYPNPVSDILTIDSEIPLTKVEIYSMLGKKVKEITSDYKSIPTYELSNGVYIVRIYSENGIATKKLIKN